MRRMIFLTLNTLDGKERKHEPVRVMVKLNGTNVDIEIDTGAAVSVISSKLYDKIKGGPLQKSDLSLKTYTGEVVKPKGVGNLVVEYSNQKAELSVMVIEGKVPTLLGRDWLGQLKLKWDELFPTKVKVPVYKLETDPKVEELKVEYPEVFSGKLGCLKDVKVTKDVQPRRVPYALSTGNSPAETVEIIISQIEA